MMLFMFEKNKRNLKKSTAKNFVFYVYFKNTIKWSNLYLKSWFAYDIPRINIKIWKLLAKYFFFFKFNKWDVQRRKCADAQSKFL